MKHERDKVGEWPVRSTKVGREALSGYRSTWTLATTNFARCMASREI